MIGRALFMTILCLALVDGGETTSSDPANDGFRLAADPPTLVSTSQASAHVEADLLIKGNILYVDQHAILTTNGKSPPQTIVGDIRGAGHKNGREGRFTWIKGFTQTSLTRIVISDSWNHCIRAFDRNTGMTSNSAGSCIRGYQDGSRDSARFWYPNSIVKDERNHCNLFVADHHNKAVRTVSVADGHVATFVRSELLYNIHGIAQDRLGTLYLTANNAIITVSYNRREAVLLAGTSTHQHGLIDGGYLTARFSIVQEIVFVRENLLMVADSGNHKLRLIDLISRSVSTVDFCGSRHASGCLDLRSPISIYVEKGAVVVGMSGKILKLTCSNNLCVPRPPVISKIDGSCVSASTTTTSTVRTTTTTSVTSTTPKPTTRSPTSSPATSLLPTRTPARRTTTAPKSTTKGRTPISQQTEMTVPPTTAWPTLPCQDKNITAYTESDLHRPLVTVSYGFRVELPLGHYRFHVRGAGSSTCIVSVQVVKNSYKPQHQLNIRARYQLNSCAEVSDPLKRAALSAVLNNYFIWMRQFCQNDCGVPEGSPRADYTCGSNVLTVLWPTTDIYDHTDIPSVIEKRLIKYSQLPILHIVILSGNTRVVYPTRTESGGYADLVLTPFCAGDTFYDVHWDACRDVSSAE